METGYATGSTSTGEAGGVKEQAQEKAQEVKEQAREQAQEVKEQASGRMRDQVDQRSTQAGQQVSQQAGDLRTVSEQLREQGKDGPARVADQIAERTERVGRYLESSDSDTILSDVEDFARRNPWAVLAGGLAVGFVASRMLKASSTNRYESRASGQLPPPRPARSGHYDTPGAGLAGGPLTAADTTRPAYGDAIGGAGVVAVESEPPLGTSADLAADDPLRTSVPRTPGVVRVEGEPPPGSSADLATDVDDPLGGPRQGPA